MVYYIMNILKQFVKTVPTNTHFIIRKAQTVSENRQESLVGAHWSLLRWY